MRQKFTILGKPVKHRPSWASCYSNASGERLKAIMTLLFIFKLSYCILFVDLQEFVPVIGIMCNKGVCWRHWERMSSIAGFDLTPESGSTLRKVLQLELEAFMEFETMLKCYILRLLYIEVFWLLRTFAHACQNILSFFSVQ